MFIKIYRKSKRHILPTKTKYIDFIYPACLCVCLDIFARNLVAFAAHFKYVKCLKYLQILLKDFVCCFFSLRKNERSKFSWHSMLLFVIARIYAVNSWQSMFLFLTYGLLKKLRLRLVF